MFSEPCENDRAGSPWDSLVSISPSPSSISLSPSPPQTQTLSYPKLVPESDYGNIEYKLQLISPSPSRFARLVTQLKWRLLEGHGQAYYELGVADSGVLVGLSPTELDQTLTTLEEMAGEIGASVVVVKEIEVPKGMIGIDQPKGDWTNKKSSRRRKNIYSFSVTPEEEFQPDDDVPFHFPTSFSTSDLDSDLSLFSMDPEPEYDSDTSTLIHSESTPAFSVDLEISQVYKPRPVRKRVHVTLKGKSKKDKDKNFFFPVSSVSSPALSNPSTSTSSTEETVEDTNKKQGAKALHRRAARDRRREMKRKLEHDKKSFAATTTGNETVNSSQSTKDPPTSLKPDSETHIHVEPPSPPPPATAPDEETVPTITIEEDEDDDDVFPPSTAVLRPSQETVPEEGEEHKRLIVEALVVRKMSLEEGYLDFGGFALEV